MYLIVYKVFENVNVFLKKVWKRRFKGFKEFLVII